MDEDRLGIEMSETEIAEFLTQQGHGVLSFGGEIAYGLPIPLGYDVLENRCVFQLLFDPGSRKDEHVDDSDAVNLVAHEWKDPDDWQSVVING